MTIVRHKNDNYCLDRNKSELIKIQRIYSKYGKILIVDGIFLNLKSGSFWSFLPHNKN